MKYMKVRLTFTDDVLGTAPADPELFKTYVANHAPNEQKKMEEIAALMGRTGDPEDNEEQEKEEQSVKGLTVFPRGDNGEPIFLDYQIRGMFKDACGFLRRVSSTRSAKLKAYKKEVDGLILIEERKIPIVFDGTIGLCERPLRAQTMQGERVALAISESIPAGATIEFTVKCYVDSDMALVCEWLDYGTDHGMGQWRNSGKGRFTWEKLWEGNDVTECAV